MPTISLGSYGISTGSGSSLLPTTSLSPGSNRKGSASTVFGGKKRSRSRRWLYPIALCSLGLFTYMTLGANAPDPDASLYKGSSSSNRGVQAVKAPSYERQNGLYLLEMDEDELIADEDLYYGSTPSPAPQTIAEKDPEEVKRKAENKEHQAVVIKQERQHQLLALSYFIAQGGILDNDFEVPGKKALEKMGGRGLEKLFVKADKAWADEKREEGSGDPESEAFEEGWQDFAKRSYRIIVFSKTYCPYSKNAKKILSTYDLSPEPFVVELDQRSDGPMIQSLLQLLTGRRTVPNVIVDLEPIGGSDDVELLHSEGGLKELFNDARLIKLPDYRYGVNGLAPIKPGEVVAEADIVRAPVAAPPGVVEKAKGV